MVLSARDQRLPFASNLPVSAQTPTRDYDCNRKTDDDREHDKSHCPIVDFEERKDLSRDLSQQPAYDRVGDRNLVNVAPP